MIYDYKYKCLGQIVQPYKQTQQTWYSLEFLTNKENVSWYSSDFVCRFWNSQDIVSLNMKQFFIKLKSNEESMDSNSVAPDDKTTVQIYKLY